MLHWLRATDDAYVVRPVSEDIRLQFLERPPLAESLIVVKLLHFTHVCGLETYIVVIVVCMNPLCIDIDSLSRINFNFYGSAILNHQNISPEVQQSSLSFLAEGINMKLIWFHTT